MTTDELSEHSHTASASTAGAHTHTAPTYLNGGNDHYNDISCSYTKDRKGTTTVNSGGAHTHSITIGKTGGNQPHNNLPPSIASYGWRRTA